jgi:hypothetical protein
MSVERYEMSDTDDCWRWGNLVVDCLKHIQEQQDTSVRFVDFEVIPPFDGNAYNIWVWFICAHSSETAVFRKHHLEEATSELRQRLILREFPKSAAVSLGTNVTSLEEIEERGGRFAYFR